MERHRRTWCLTASAALALVVAPLQSGCNIIAPAYFIIHGPPKVPALYVLPDRPTVVFVDDRRNVIATNADRTRRLIAEVTSNELMTKGVLAVTIRPQDALALAKQVDRHKSVLAIDALGEAVGAQQVIYIEMVDFRETADGTPRPVASCALKVVDVVNKVRLFPASESVEDAYLVQVDMPPLSMDMYDTRQGRDQVYQLLATQLGIEIAKLFYTHDVEELGSRLNPDY